MAQAVSEIGSVGVGIGTYPCAEPGCEGRVKVEAGNVVSLRSGASAFVSVYPCSDCGRLHHQNGEPVFSLAFQLRVFWRQEEGLFYKKLTAEEQDQHLSDLIVNLDQALASGRDLIFCRRQIQDYLRLIGHAEDCSFRPGSSACDCGVHRADKILQEKGLPIT